MDSPIVALTTPEMRRLYAYWRGKCQGDRLPGRQHFDPLDIPDLLPQISLFDVVKTDNEVRFRIRLLGTANVALMGGDCTGHFLDEQLRPEEAEPILDSYRRAVEQRAPHYMRGSLATPGREHVDYERLLLPLAGDGRTVDMLVALFLPLDPAPNRA